MSRLNDATEAMVKQYGYAFSTGFLQGQLVEAVALLPKTKQKLFMAQLEHVVGQMVKVKVTNILSGKEVELPWDDVGGCCDPSTERYHSM